MEKLIKLKTYNQFILFMSSSDILHETDLVTILKPKCKKGILIWHHFSDDIPLKQIKMEGLKSGKILLVIGTHALLGKSIEFSNLGLLIIDEEQHFGVAQKEKLKQIVNHYTKEEA